MAKNQITVAPAPKKTGAEAKKDALATALAQIEKQFGKGAVMKLGDNAAMQVDSISTGSLGLDMALGVGGVPRGRIVEVYGPESSGKTTLALHVLAEAQKKGGEVAFIDVEHALDPVYAEALGVDINNLLVSQPDTGEQAMEICEALVRSGAIDAIVVGTAVREGAVSVTQLEMMPKAPDTRTPDNPWPEWPKICKTDYGQQEAIAVYGHDPRIYETTVKEFIKDKDGNVKAAKCVKLDWKKNPETGRMTMTEIEGSEYIVDCDVVLIAAGFLGCQTYVAESFGVELNERTNVKTPCPNSYTTNVPKVFVAGDMHRGQSLVVWAIREGREAAMAVEELLLGYTNLQ